MNLQNIIQEINECKESKDLHIINKAIISRLKLIRTFASITNRMSLSVGDTVKLSGLKKLSGLTVKIQEMGRTRCTIRVPNDFYGKWRGQLVTVPLSSCEKVEGIASVKSKTNNGIETLSL